MESEQLSSAQPSIDASGNVVIRAPGCLAALVMFAAILSLVETITPTLPAWSLALSGIVLGALCVSVYIGVARARWGTETPDVVQMLGNDLQVIGRRSLADFRLRFGPGSSWGDKLLHEVLYTVKWLGHLLMFSGAGFLIYQLLAAIGVVSS